MTAKVDALLVDLGGVIMTLDWDQAFSRWAGASGRPVEELRRRWSPDEPYERHERGEIDEPAYYASLRHSLGIDIGDDEFAAGWSAIFAGEIAETVAALREVRGRIPMYAFSNTNTGHQRVWAKRHAAALTLFDKVFVSWELGVRKPERAAFERISREIGVPVERILFFDDTLANVEGALAAGLQAVHVTTPQDVKDALRQRIPTQ